MEDERDRQSGGDAAQQKTPRPECEESRPLSVEVRLLARGCLARSLAPLVPVRRAPPARGRRASGKFRVRMLRKHSAGALAFRQLRGADWLS